MLICVTGMAALLSWGYLRRMCLGPTVMVAAGGTRGWLAPDIMEIPRFGNVMADLAVRSPSLEKIFFNSATNCASAPSTETPNETEPAGCTVRRLSKTGILDFSKPLEFQRQV